MAKFEAARADGTFMVICKTPDVCKTPPAGQPVPYQIVGMLSDCARESGNVRVRGKPAMTLNSRVTRVVGNEAGAMGGVKSSVNVGYCKPLTYSSTFRINGHNILYQTKTDMEMNCTGPDGPGNTVGQLIYLGPQASATVGPGGPAADPTIEAEIPAEAGFIDQLISVDGIASLAQMAPQLATMDWSNPMSALSALQGFAGIGGLDQLAGAAAIVQQGAAIVQDPKAALGLLGPLGDMVGLPVGQLVGLATTDWSNPGAILGAASNLSGLGEYLGSAGSALGLLPSGWSPADLLPSGLAGNGDDSWLAAAKDGLAFLQKNDRTLSVLAGGLWSFVSPQRERPNDPMVVTTPGTLTGNGDPNIRPETPQERSVGLFETTFRPVDTRGTCPPVPDLSTALQRSAVEPIAETGQEAIFLKRSGSGHGPRRGR